MSSANAVPTAQLYTPIKKWQTRILRLLPGQDSDELRADLLVAGLIHDEGVILSMDHDEPVSYEAISYTWGSGQAVEPIVVNGLEHRINPALAGALRRFRYPDSDRWLWADQLCINQADNAEKSVQVCAMFTIFRKAKRVLAWLGEADKQHDLAIAHYLTLPKSERLAIENEEMFEALALLCLRPWARRVWIQQEVFAARDLSMHCGLNESTLDEYKIISQIPCESSALERKYPRLLQQRDALERLSCSDEKAIELERVKLESLRLMRAESMRGKRFLQRAVGVVQETDRGDLLANTLLEAVMPRSRNLEATDPRDFIYALISLTHHPIESGTASVSSALPIDYSRPVARVFQDATRCILNRDRSLRILAWSGLAREHQSNARPNLGVRLPSWMVDWTTVTNEDLTPPRRTKLADIVASNQRVHFEGMHRPPEVPTGWEAADLVQPPTSTSYSALRLQEDVGDGLLRIRGFRLARVLSVQSQLPSRPDDHTLYTQLPAQMMPETRDTSHTDVSKHDLVRGTLNTDTTALASYEEMQPTCTSHINLALNVVDDAPSTYYDTDVSSVAWFEQADAVRTVSDGGSNWARGLRPGDLFVQADGYHSWIVLRPSQANGYYFVALTDPNKHYGVLGLGHVQRPAQYQYVMNHIVAAFPHAVEEFAIV